MARFLFSVQPARGHIYPSLPIATALRAAGHDVAYTTRPEFRPLLEPQGITYFPLDASSSAVTPLTSPAAIETGRDRAAMLKALFRALFIAPAPAVARSVGAAIAAFEPDVIVHDRRSWGPSLAAERAGLPWATLSLTCCNLPGENLAPFGQGLPPAHDATTRARYAALRHQTEAFFADVRAEWNALRAAHGLPPHAGPLATAALSPDLLILLGLAEIDYERDDLPASAHYVGACAWDPPEPMAAETARWLAALPPEMPLALVSASTAALGDHPDRRSAALIEAALAGLPDAGFAVLATLPFDHALHGAPLPRHTHVARFVPHTQVLPRAAVMVTHGGFGAALKALGQGVPLIVVPFAGDQPEVAQRVAARGAGVRLNPAALNADSLRDAILRVHYDSQYRDAARRIGASLARHNGPAEAASLLESFARQRSTASRAAAYAGASP